MLLATLRLGASIDALAGSIRAGPVRDPSTFAVKARGSMDPAY